MGVIVKLADNKYVDWSKVCDAPSSAVMDRETMEDYVRGIEEHDLGYRALENAEEHAKSLMLELMDQKVMTRLARIEKNGTSSMMGHTSAEEFVRCNRAGPGEAQLTLAEIIELYTYTPEKKGTFPFGEYP